jgi:type I restriction enzyme S subunit
MKNVPKLRFKDDNGRDFPTWESHPLGTLGEFKNGINKSKEDFGKGVPFINLMDVFGKPCFSGGNVGLVNAKPNEISNYNLLKGDVLFIRSSVKIEGVGETSVIIEDLPNTVYSGFLIRFRENKKKIIDQYKKYCFGNRHFRNQVLSVCTTSANTNINQDALNNLTLNFPTLEEQTKIADFLTAIDDRISQLSQKCDGLAQYKKGVMQQIFSQELRFKDEQGRAFPAWDSVDLGNLAFKVNTKNKDDSISKVLTNSAVQGIVSQNDFFDKDIANKNNLEGYYVVELNDFVYNPRISSSAPVGPVKRNNLAKGVMSPLYTVFRFKSECLDFLEYFFETTYWHDHMRSVSNMGARFDRMNITNEGFFALPIALPSIAEQAKIAGFLSAVDEKISHAQAQRDALKQYKQGLLQQMFV